MASPRVTRSRCSATWWGRARSRKSRRNVTVFREHLRQRLTVMALQQFERKEVDLATETLHRSIDSGRRLFEAGERLIDDLNRLWQQTVRSDGWASAARRE